MTAQPVTAANFVMDVNAIGTLTLADKGITNENVIKALAAPLPVELRAMYKSAPK